MAIAAVVVALAAWVLWPRGTTEVTTEAAVAQFRSSRGGTGAQDTAGRSDPQNPVPEPGVYEYRASGTQHVKLGPLPGEDRTLPGTVTIVVGEPTRAPGGEVCFDWTLNLFAEHTETTTWCSDNKGTLRLTAHTKHQSIGALSPTATVSCDPDMLITGDGDGADDGDEVAHTECTLDLSGGPVSVEAELGGTATTGHAEEWTPDGGEATTRPLAVSYDVSGSLTGTWTETYLLAENLLPVRIERDLDLSGPARLQESSVLELTSTTPAR